MSLPTTLPAFSPAERHLQRQASLPTVIKNDEIIILDPLCINANKKLNELTKDITLEANLPWYSKLRNIIVRIIYAIHNTFVPSTPWLLKSAAGYELENGLPSILESLKNRFNRTIINTSNKTSAHNQEIISVYQKTLQVLNTNTFESHELKKCNNLIAQFEATYNELNEVLEKQQYVQSEEFRKAITENESLNKNSHPLYNPFVVRDAIAAIKENKNFVENVQILVAVHSHTSFIMNAETEKTFKLMKEIAESKDLKPVNTTIYYQASLKVLKNANKLEEFSKFIDNHGNPNKKTLLDNLKDCICNNEMAIQLTFAASTIKEAHANINDLFINVNTNEDNATNNELKALIEVLYTRVNSSSSQ